MRFKDLLLDAQTNHRSSEKILEMYQPLLIKKSIVNGRFDEDLYQELVIILLRCIRTFQI